MSNIKRIHSTAAIRLLGVSAFAIALFASLPASAGRFTEQDATGPAFQGPTAVSITPSATQSRQKAAADTVLTDTPSDIYNAVEEREAGTPPPSPFLRNFGAR